MATWISEDDARELLVRRVAAAGTVEKFAKEVGCSTGLVSEAMRGVKPVGPTLGRALGLIASPLKTYRYLPKDEQTHG